MRMMEGHSVERREGDVETLQRRAHGIVSRNLCQFFGMANCHFNAIHDWSLSVFVFRSKAQRIKRPKVAKLAFFHVSSQGQFYICRMQGSSGLHESDTNQDKVQGIFLMFMRHASHRFWWHFVTRSSPNRKRCILTGAYLIQLFWTQLNPWKLHEVLDQVDLCPVCLRKLSWNLACGTHEAAPNDLSAWCVQRYRRLLSYVEKLGPVLQARMKRAPPNTASLSNPRIQGFFGSMSL